MTEHFKPNLAGNEGRRIEKKGEGMAKIIRIEDCGRCPHSSIRDARRGFCSMLGREIGDWFKIDKGKIPIPDWCPLEDEGNAKP